MSFTGGKRGDYIVEPSRRTRISAEYDTVVVGGGVAGIAAALSSARAGAKTALLERQFALGGLASLGLISLYLPLCDGMGQQVSFGIAEELLRLSVQDDEPRHPVLDWNRTERAYKMQERFRCDFNPSYFSIAAEQLLLKEGVSIIYGVQVCACVMCEDRIAAVLTEGIEGRCAISAKSFVDASGDAILCSLAGEATASYEKKNILAAWYHKSDSEGFNKRISLGAADVPEGYQRKAPSLNDKRYDCLSSTEQTAFMLDAHAALLEDFLKGGKLTKTHQLSAIATIPQLRMTRRLKSNLELSEPTHSVLCKDSIGMIGNWKKSGPIYEIPFACLHGQNVKNLIAAGRCISTDERMWDNTRAIPACAVTGEAAGLAAALFSDFTQADTPLLQSILAKRGIPLHHSELKVKHWDIKDFS